MVAVSPSAFCRTTSIVAGVWASSTLNVPASVFSPTREVYLFPSMVSSTPSSLSFSTTSPFNVTATGTHLPANFCNAPAAALGASFLMRMFLNCTVIGGPA